MEVSQIIEEIKKKKKAMRYTAVELATEAGITTATLHNLLKQKNVTIKALFAVLNVLELNISLNDKKK